MKFLPTAFDGEPIRRVYDEATETWWFSVVDVVQVLTQQADHQTARKYWNQLKGRLAKDGSESVTSCHRLKLPAADGKNYLTDVATAATLLRLVQSVPSPNAEPIKRWLAKVAYERMQEMADLAAAHSLAYAPCGFGMSAVKLQAESADYGACTLVLNGLRVCFRVAKTTPTKTGQFVTLWKRANQGPIQPFDLSDPVDAFVVSTCSGSQFGQFVFPKAVLATKGVLATHGHGGKRAIRVYPPWAATTSRQAQATQTWQAAYFLDLSAESAVDLVRVRWLFKCQKSL